MKLIDKIFMNYLVILFSILLLLYTLILQPILELVNKLFTKIDKLK